MVSWMAGWRSVDDTSPNRATSKNINGRMAKWKRRGLQNHYARVRFPLRPQKTPLLAGFIVLILP